MPRRSGEADKLIDKGKQEPGDKVGDVLGDAAGGLGKKKDDT